jgi:hypothetical protein
MLGKIVVIGVGTIGLGCSFVVVSGCSVFCSFSLVAGFFLTFFLTLSTGASFSFSLSLGFLSVGSFWLVGYTSFLLSS